MELLAVVWLALLVALVLLFAAVFRRMSALAARTRELERLQGAVESIDLRLAGVVDPLVRVLDETRRHAGDPAALASQATDAQAVIDELASETRALVAPPGLVVPIAAMGTELGRAARAVALVEHGLAGLANAGIGRDLEAQTSIKRGTLNLRIARDAFAQLARQVAAVRPADLAAGSADARTLVSPAAGSPAPEGDESDDG